MPKVSIIIPVYNTAPYLRECLDSVVNQTLKDIEIIIVDDGSTDGSTEICKEYAAKDCRIKLLIQENQGVVVARNSGISLASAPYVGFVDSDDYIELDMYEELLNHIGSCDMAICGYYLNQLPVFDVIPHGSYQTAEEMQYIFDNMVWCKEKRTAGLFTAIWNKLFQTNIQKNNCGNKSGYFYWRRCRTFVSVYFGIKFSTSY